MQQPVIEDDLPSYDTLFPRLPESTTPNQNNTMGQWNTKMRLGSSRITQVFR